MRKKKKKKKTDSLMKKIKKTMDILKQKVDVLKKATEKVIPQKVSDTVVKSVKTGIDYLKNIWEKRKLPKDEAKKEVKKRFLDCNKKIGEMLKKPEFGIREKNLFCWEKIYYQGERRLFSS